MSVWYYVHVSECMVACVRVRVNGSVRVHECMVACVFVCEWWCVWVYGSVCVWYWCVCERENIFILIFIYIYFYI